MVDEASKRCGHQGCTKQPSYGVEGTKKAELCSQHAAEGMVNVKRGRWGHKGCNKWPSFGVAGTKKAELCARAPEGGDGGRDQQEVRASRVQQGPVERHGRNQEGGALLSARLRGNGGCDQQEVWPPRVHQALVVWYGRDQEGRALRPAQTPGRAWFMSSTRRVATKGAPSGRHSAWRVPRRPSSAAGTPWRAWWT